MNVFEGFKSQYLIIQFLTDTKWPAKSVGPQDCKYMSARKNVDKQQLWHRSDK